MTAAATTLALAAAFIFGYAPAYVLALKVRARRDRRTPLVVGLSSAEWDELKALQNRARAEFESTPIYDRMVCEQIEKAEGWTA